MSLMEIWHENWINCVFKLFLTYFSPIILRLWVSRVLKKLFFPSSFDSISGKQQTFQLHFPFNSNQVEFSWDSREREKSRRSWLCKKIFFFVSKQRIIADRMKGAKLWNWNKMFSPSKSSELVVMMMWTSLTVAQLLAKRIEASLKASKNFFLFHSNSGEEEEFFYCFFFGSDLVGGRIFSSFYGIFWIVWLNLKCIFNSFTTERAFLVMNK